MIRLLLLCLLVLFSLHLHAQIQWGHQVGSIGRNDIENHVVDKDGNIFAGGSFEGTITIGSQTFTSMGGTDMFLYKANSAGKVLWAKSFADPQNGGAIGIATDKMGNLYVGGVFTDALILDGKTLMEGEGVFNAFIAKFDGKGELLWIKGILTKARYASANLVGVITASPEGEVVVPIQFWGEVQLENQRYTSQNPRGNDMLVVKLSATGQVMWTSRSDHDGAVYPREVKLDHLGQVYLTGAYLGTYRMGQHSISTGPNSWDDIFVAKLDKNGRPIWLKGFNNSLDWFSNTGMSLEIEPKTNSIYLTGRFRGRVDFGGIVLEEDTEWSGGVPADIFILNMTEHGTVNWAKRFGEWGHDIGWDMRLLPTGGFVVAGAWNFKPYVQWFDAVGNPGDRIVIDAVGYVNTISLTRNGAFYISGQFQGPLKTENISWNANGVLDGFLFKFDPCAARIAAGSGYKTYNVMTPNGDGKNDYFALDPLLVGAKLQVYNRWGIKVYESSSYTNDWNANGLPEAVYHWVATHECSGTLKGTVTIIR